MNFEFFADLFGAFSDVLGALDFFSGSAEAAAGE